MRIFKGWKLIRTYLLDYFRHCRRLGRSLHTFTALRIHCHTPDGRGFLEMICCNDEGGAGDIVLIIERVLSTVQNLLNCTHCRTAISKNLIEIRSTLVPSRIQWLLPKRVWVTYAYSFGTPNNTILTANICIGALIRMRERRSTFCNRI